MLAFSSTLNLNFGVLQYPHAVAILYGAINEGGRGGGGGGGGAR